jgi:hypothetical protein
MSPVSVAEQEVSGFACWVVEPYGAPDATSEVSRIAGFYAAEALTVLGDAQCGSTERTQFDIAFDKAA